MNQASHDLSEKIFPRAPVRQWVLSFPLFLRYLMAYDPKVVTGALNIYINTIQDFYKQQVPKRFKRKDLSAAAVTVVQRFGSALNLNVHFHSFFIDGAYCIDSIQQSLFFKAKPPTPKELEKLVLEMRQKTLRWLHQKGYLLEEYINHEKTQNPRAELQEASIRYRIAVGPRRGQAVERIKTQIEQTTTNTKRGKHSFSYKGFSIHAGVYISPNKRNKLEKLTRYISRGALAKSRLYQLPNKQIAYRLKNKWSDGTSHAIFTPIELIEKIVALIPPPRANLIRYHGLFAPNAKHRNKIIKPSRSSKKKAQNNKNLKWAEMLKKTFGINIMECEKCGGDLQKIGIVRDYSQAQIILKSLKIRAQLPCFKPASQRGPPMSNPTDDQDFNQAPPGW